MKILTNYENLVKYINEAQTQPSENLAIAFGN